MRKFIASLLLLGLPASAADPPEMKGYYTMSAMGCMLVRECTDGVEPIWGIDFLKEKYPNSDWDPIAKEFQRMLKDRKSVV